MAENRGQAVPFGHTRRKNHAMILREWRARASPSNADAYPRHFREKVVPELRKVPGFAFLHSYWNVLKATAPTLRVNIQSLEVRDPSEFESAFDTMTRERADGLIVLSDTFATFYRVKLAELAAYHRLPTVYGHGQYPAAGGLMSYGPLLTDVYRRAASHVDKILKGGNPPNLPVEQPTKFELVINLKTAKALGLTVPPTLLARADEVIE